MRESAGGGGVCGGFRGGVPRASGSLWWYSSRSDPLRASSAGYRPGWPVVDPRGGGGYAEVMRSAGGGREVPRELRGRSRGGSVGGPVFPRRLAVGLLPCPMATGELLGPSVGFFPGCPPHASSAGCCPGWPVVVLGGAWYGGGLPNRSSPFMLPQRGGPAGVASRSFLWGWGTPRGVYRMVSPPGCVHGVPPPGLPASPGSASLRWAYPSRALLVGLLPFPMARGLLGYLQRHVVDGGEIPFLPLPGWFSPFHASSAGYQPGW